MLLVALMPSNNNNSNKKSACLLSHFGPSVLLKWTLRKKIFSVVVVYECVMSTYALPPPPSSPLIYVVTYARNRECKIVLLAQIVSSIKSGEKKKSCIFFFQGNSFCTLKTYEWNTLLKYLKKMKRKNKTRTRYTLARKQNANNNNNNKNQKRRNKMMWIWCAHKWNIKSVTKNTGHCTALKWRTKNVEWKIK